MSEDSENEKHAYVSHDDVCKCYQNQTLLAIQAPSGTQLEVPPPDIVTTNGGATQKARYRIHLTSTNGPICVLLVNHDCNTDSSVAMTIPPPPVSAAMDTGCGSSTMTDAGGSGEASHDENNVSGDNNTTSEPTPMDCSSLDDGDLHGTNDDIKEEDNVESLTESADGSMVTPDVTHAPVNSLKFEPAGGIGGEIFAPLLRLSPPPGEEDYYFNLEDSEGVCDLFDVPPLK